MKKPADIGKFKTPAEAKAAGHDPSKYRVAGVHETMGPHFKPILWVNGKPYVLKEEMISFKEYILETSSWKDKKGIDKSKPWAQQVRNSVEKERQRLERIKNTKGYDAYLKALKMLKESKYDDSGILKSMTPDKAVKVLEKTWKSISSHVGRGGSVHSWRGSELRMRYDDHRDYLRDKHMKTWEAYCKKHGHHIDHNGSDMFA